MLLTLTAAFSLCVMVYVMVESGAYPFQFAVNNFTDLTQMFQLCSVLLWTYMFLALLSALCFFFFFESLLSCKQTILDLQVNLIISPTVHLI